jgi:parallel beta-helix repeat protein
MKKTRRLWMTVLMISSLHVSLVRLLLFNEGLSFNELGATGNQYYFSSFRGNDNNIGTSSSSPWKSTDKLNSIIPSLAAGDEVFFERGSEWDNVNVNIQNISGTESNPILFTAYGSGSLPRFKGSTVVTSFSQTGNIWKTVNASLPEYNPTTYIRVIPFVYINNKKYDCSRYPNDKYLNTSTTGANNKLTDESQNWAGNYWNNALIAVRYINWRWSTRRVNSNNTNTLYFDNMDRSYEKPNSPYLIRNHVNACDLKGEWAQQNDSLWVYYPDNLNNQKVEVPIVHSVFKINNSKNILIKDLQIEKALVYGVYINASKVNLTGCNISDAGGMLVFAENHSIVKTTENFFTGGRRGGVFYDFSQGTVSGNTFKQMYFSGIDNTEHTYGASIASWRSDGKFYSEYNRMDSINLGYNMHWSNDSVWIQRNYITNFGFTVRDAAAIYFGSDFTGPAQGSTKFVNNNIINNAITDFVHGIYIDSNSNFVKCDSNSIANTNIAVFIHVSHDNSVRNTNIINPAKDMTVYAWNQAIRLDEYSFKYGEGTAVTNNVLSDNVVVLGETANENAVFLLNITNMGSNRFERNRYFDPFGSSPKLFGICTDYSIYNYYSLQQWGDMTGADRSSFVNPTNYTFNSSLSISKNRFVKMISNPTKQAISYDMRKLDAYYLDIHGEPVGDYLTVKPYYSEILFYKGERIPIVEESPVIDIIDVPVIDTIDVVDNTPVTDTSDTEPVITNNAPVINDHFFNINEEDVAGSVIGTLIATDQDQDQNQNQQQELTYAIVSGNESGYFTLDPVSAEIRLSKKPDYNYSNKYTLGVMVTDNGTPSKSASANVAITQKAKSGTVYIDPTNINDPEEDGSIEHPYDSWNDVKWIVGNKYLQKKSTTTNMERITVSANAVTLGAYGEGDLPEIVSNSKDFVFAFYEKSNVVISELNLKNESGVSLIYFLGSSTNNIVERCKLEGSNYGVKIVDGSNYTIRYNIFKDNDEGVCSYSENTRIYYNIFKENKSAINISSYLSSAEIFNNVFYDNYQALRVSYADLVLYNNIFYLSNYGDKAIEGNFENLMSDNNLFYPQQKAFLKINGVVFNTLNELQLAFRQDVNSLCEDPLFNDVLNGDFGLEENSPAINAGKLLSGLSLDFLGLQVPVGNKPDIGATEAKYEHIEKQIDTDNMLVYPNPSSGEFEVTLQVSNPVNAILDIFDLNGRKIHSGTIDAEEMGASMNKKIDITHVPNGLYLLRVVIGKKVMSSQILVN